MDTNYIYTGESNYATKDPIPANSFASYEFGRIGDRYTTGIALAVTGAIGATDTTNAVAGVYIKTNYI